MQVDNAKKIFFEKGNIEVLIKSLRDHVQTTRPDLLTDFDLYSNEAKHGYLWLSKELSSLNEGSKILEIGSGILILSYQLTIDGFEVTSVEPLADGFETFNELQNLTIQYFENEKLKPKLVNVFIEEYSEINYFDFSFSINVMEHVSNISRAIESVTSALKKGGVYRFSCPNYLFPYEPHFNILTLISKRITFLLFKNSILTSKRVLNQKAMWDSLNWINPIQLRAIAHKIKELEIRFEKEILIESFERVLQDQDFAKRRGVLLANVVRLIVAVKLHKILALFPVYILPIMDCTIIKH